MKNWELETETMILFWGGVFSNWAKFSFTLDNIEWNCVEQFMMAEKALLFGDNETYELILKTSDPKKQKALGRSVKNFDAAIWSEKARDLVYRGLVEKFKQNQELKTLLLSTGDKIIVEASPFDKIWGIGMDHLNPLALNQATWDGTNWLGELTMRAREELRNE